LIGPRGPERPKFPVFSQLTSQGRNTEVRLTHRWREPDSNHRSRLVRRTKPAARFERTPAEIRGPAPRIGEHSVIILADLGLEAAEIERLAAEKIVRLVKT
jgi:crotonobetainyl-CoA:carnitine CoA-transferase CaiB-like acyl-CoA transferase